jgi:enoyl-CoA hydratase/carnithine racemase
MSEGAVVVERPRPDVAVVRMNRPERLNALSMDQVERLHSTLDDLDADNDLLVLVLTGEGRGFCSGLDLKSASLATRRSEGLSGPRAALVGQSYFSDLMAHVRRVHQVVIAAVNGPAYGGGFALTLACDIRLAAQSARFCTQAIRIGVSGAESGMSYLLPRLIGASRAHELILTAREIDGAEAERIGLVSEVVADEALLARALEMAETIFGYSDFAVVMTKQLLWANLDAPSLEAAKHLEDRTQVLASYTGEIGKAAADFAARRPSGT